MTNRFELIIDSSAEDIKVRKMLIMLLGTWALKFKGEQGMQILQRLHDKGREKFQQNSNKVSKNKGYFSKK